MIGWLRSWGGALLVLAGTFLGLGFLNQLSCSVALTLHILAGITFVGAGILCHRDYKLAKARDKEEELRKPEAGIQPTVISKDKNGNIKTELK